MNRFDDKNIRRPDRAAQDKLVSEQKKALAAKLLQRRSLVAESPSSPAQGDVGVPTLSQVSAPAPPLPAVKAPIEPLPAALNMKLWADDAATQLHAVSAVEYLAGHLLHAASTRSHQLILLWPGSLRPLSLAHALATATRWHQGDKQGLRTLVYPAKANFLQALNHAHIDRADLIKLAHELLETSPNDRVKVSLKDKDSFWFSLNSVKADETGAIHPTLAEILPHYFADKDFTQWRSCDGDLLRHVKARITDAGHRHALNALAIKSLSDPETAPDALFAISWRASHEDIRQALRRLRNARRPEVILLDVTRALRKDNPSWKGNLVRFVECVRDAWPTDTPPLLIVIDEPHVRNQLRQELDKRAAKKSDAAAWLAKSGLPIRGVVCSVARDGLMPASQPEPRNPAPRSIHLAIIDSEAATVIESIDKLRSAPIDPKWVPALADAGSYISRLAALPSSTRVLVNWLGEADVPMAVRENYAWPVYRSKLEQMLHDPTFPDRQRLQRVIDRANALWTNYENGTPLARRLADLIEEHTRGTETCCVAFTRPTARRLAERYFETYDGYPEGAGFEVLRDCARFVVSRDLDTEAALSPKETLILVGLDEESLRLLLLDERISSPAYVLLTRRNAAYLKATLRAVRAMPGFASLTARIDTLVPQLPEFTEEDERLAFQRGDFVLPTFSFEQGLATAVPEHEESDPNAWAVVLEGGMSIRRSPQTRAYVYDPSLSHTPSRGFRGIDVDRLQEGDRLFVMSFELREMTEAALKSAGLPISNDKRFENDLRLYHDRVRELAASIPGVNLAYRARAALQSVCAKLGPKVAPPAEATVRSWLDVDRFRDVSFENAKPGAPRSEAHFSAFAKALGFDDFEAVYFWKAVIQPLRGTRRADGRRVTDVYTELLLEPESAVVHRRLKPAVVQDLFAHAKENVHVIEAIQKPLGVARDE